MVKRKSASRPKRKGKWMGRARASMKRRGTVGDFTKWCRSLGYRGVTAECIRRGLASRSAKRKKQAAFAKGARTVARRKKKGKRK